jgi:YD repeat-containing protein
VDVATNRLTAPAGYTMSYDNAGNLTNDTYTGQGQRTYDAENHMTQAWANSQWQVYTYNGDGQRVRRNVNGVETWQVYGMDGELTLEKSPDISPRVSMK